MKLIKNKLIILLMAVTFLSACNLTSPTTNSIGSSSNSSAITSSTDGSSVVQDVSIILSSVNSSNLFVGLATKVIINANVTGASTDNLEWYLDEVKSINQRGRLFEFIPVEIKEYSVYAMIDNNKSNILKFNYDLPSFTIQNFRIVNSTNIQLVGDPGYTFALSGINIATSSSYNISTKTYNINLLNPLTQGTNYNMVISKDRFKDLTYPFVFESRILDVGYILYDGKKISLNSDGVYRIARPFTGSQGYTVSLNHRNLEGTNIPFTLTTSVPATAAPIATVQNTRTIQRDINIDSFFTLTSASIPGLYVHSFDVGGRKLNVTIQVVIPTPNIDIDTAMIYDVYNKSSMSTPYALDADGDYINELATKDNAGNYVIYRPYNGEKYALTFRIKAENFTPPTGLTGNQFFLRAGVIGPVGAVVFYNRTVSTATSNVMPAEASFAASGTIDILHYIDETTDVGTYNYTFTVYGAVAPTSKTFTVIVKKYDPTIKPFIIYNGEELKANSDGSYTFFKPIGSNPLTASIGTLIEYYESPKFPNPQSISGTGFDTRYESTGGQNRWLLNFSATYSGPLSRLPMSTKLALELGQSVSAEDTTEVDQINSLVVIETYDRFISDGFDAVLDLSNLLDLDNYADSTNIFTPLTSITTSTFPGVHTFRVQIGELTTSIIIRVEEPRPLILTKDNTLRYGFQTLSKDNIVFDKTVNKYYVDGKNGTLAIDIFPFGMPTGSYPYTYTLRKPSGLFQSTTNTVTLTLKSPYDGTLTFPNSGTGSEMIVRDQLDQEGEYIYSFTINNQSISFNIVVLASPQLRVDSVKYNEIELDRSVDNFYLLRANTSRYLDIILTPVNIKDDYEYVLSTTGVFPTGENLVAAKRSLSTVDGFIKTGVEIGASSGAATTEAIDSVYIALYDGTNIIGEITRIFIISRPLNYSTIYFYSNGGSVVSPVTKPIGTSSFDLSSLSTRTGFTLSWFTNPELTGSAISNSFTFSAADTILYAKWTANP